MRSLILLVLASLLTACAPEARPIEYGTDKCDYCRMTVVDKQHAAEVVTSKGKVYKFDAIECQVQYLQEHADTEYAFRLVTDYMDNSGALVAAESCTYLISPNLSSPMGANLTAFADEQVARQFQQEKTGELYNWTTLQAQLAK